MWSRSCWGCLLTVLLFTSVRSQEDKETADKEHGPQFFSIPIDSIDLSGSDVFSTDSSLQDVIQPIANKLNCTKIQIEHTGNRIDKESAHGSIFRPTTTSSTIITTTEDLKDLKYHVEAGTESEYDGGVTPNPENEATVKPIKDDEKTRSKRSTDDVNPSKNVTIHHNYSVVKKYPLEMAEPEKQPNKTECTAPFDDYGEQYNWYQIIIDNGGAPGEVNGTRLTPNVTRVLNPCERPITETEPKLEDLLYEYELIEFEKVYRREEAYLRFAGTDSEFVDIHGHFVWSPPGYPRRYYRLEYREDDTGFYIEVHQGQKCVFSQNPVSIKCDKPLETCFCDDDGSEVCRYFRIFSPGLSAALVGGG